MDEVVNTDFVLELGSASDSIEVVAGAVQLDAQSASMGTVVESSSIVNLPLSQRSAYALTLLVPGVVPAREGALANTFVGAYTFRVNGGGQRSSEVMLDGITNSVAGAYPVNFAVLLPPPDSVEEFKVQTSTYMAEYGRSGGGIINTIMKSGTNSFHGSAHEFFQNNILNANGFFANKNGQPRTGYKRNQFGGVFGGPIKHNKLFFFGSWESLRQGSQAARTDTVPTLLERQGDFSQSYQLVGGNCTPIQIYDPATTRPNPNGAGSIRDLFPGNVIPVNRLDKVGAKWASYYPNRNTTGVRCTNANNFYGQGINTLNTSEVDAKFDWNASEKDHLFVGLGIYNFSNLNSNLWATAADTGGSNNGPNSQPAKSIRADYTRAVSPTFLLDFRGGAVRWQRSQDPFPQGWQMTNLGFPSSLQAQMSQPVSFPFTTADSFSGMGANISYIFQASTVYQAVANATWVRGQHTIKFGGEYRIEQTFENTGLSTSGSYTFSKSFTQGPNPNTAAANLGSGIATMLLGLGTGSTPSSPGVFTSSRYSAFYIQDKVKVTSKLTVDVGLRYDLEIPRKERNNELSYWDFYSPSPLSAQVPSLPNLHG